MGGRHLLAAGLVVAGAVAAWPVARVLRDPVGEAPPHGFDAARPAYAYETSRACETCHPSRHASWRRTHHARMTQLPSEETIVAPFDGTPFTVMGVTTVPRRVGSRFVLDTLSPVSGERETLDVALVTGSRRMQQFHARFGDATIRLPVAWSIEEGRWFHLDEAFFHGPGRAFGGAAATWNLNCIFCHDVKPSPGLRPDGSLESSVAELGIACEACHGPGEEHARRMRSPLRRAAMRALGGADPTIVHPERLDARRSVEVCGHCHGQRVPTDPASIERIMMTGDPYVPGQVLGATWTPIFRDTKVFDLDFSQRFWKDGSPRLTAYEYQGLLRSPCFTEGGMTCLSCHAMHEGDPAGQIRPDRIGDAACAPCHAMPQGHSAHAPESPGSRCAACHMPPEVYGIMTWHPTHEIVSPDPGRAAAADKPDACTTCHVGRSRAWAVAAADRAWPGREGAPSDPLDDAAEIPRALLRGDVVRRAHAAWALGLGAPEREARTLAVPLLAEALVDPFPSVRRAASASLARLTGRPVPRAFDDVAAREAMRRELQAGPFTPAAGWPVRADGSLDRVLIDGWMASREEVAVDFGE